MSFHTWRTAVKQHRCTGRDADDCTRTIQPGERYCVTALLPNSDLGNIGWWNGKLCTPCAGFYRDVPEDPKAVAEDDEGTDESHRREWAAAGDAL